MSTSQQPKIKPMVQDGPAAAGSTAAVGSEGGESCLICGQDLEQPNNDRAPLLAGARGWDLKKLSCGHRYHRACVVALYNYGIKAPCPRCYVPPADQADQQFDAAIRCRVRAHMAMEEQSNADLHTEADRLLRGALKAGPEHANAHNHLGNTLLTEAKDVDGAIAAFHKAIAADKHHPSAHYNLGGALYRKGQIEAAIAQLKKSTSLHPQFAVAHHDLGTALYNKEKIDAAIAQYKRVLAINPQSVAAHFSLSKAYRRKCLAVMPQSNAYQRYQTQADESLRKAREINPDFGKKPPPPDFWEDDDPKAQALQFFIIALAVGLLVAFLATQITDEQAAFLYPYLPSN